MALSEAGVRLSAERFFEEYPDDGKPYELEDGELLAISTPSIRHQQIVRLMGSLVEPEVERLGGQVFCPGVGVMVSEGVVQVPDVAVLIRALDQSNHEIGLQVAPDLVIEVLSRTTARRDRTIKAERYAAFGVRELWLVSPEAETIEVFALRDGRRVLHARVGLDEPLRSVVLPGVTFPASAAFAV